MPFLSYCIFKLSIQTAVVDNDGRFESAPGLGGDVGNPAKRIRKFFPETWIWDLIPVGYVSCTMALLFICKTVVFVFVYLTFVYVLFFLFVFVCFVFFLGGGHLHSVQAFSCNLLISQLL